MAYTGATTARPLSSRPVNECMRDTWLCLSEAGRGGQGQTLHKCAVQRGELTLRGELAIAETHDTSQHRNIVTGAGTESCIVDEEWA